MSLIKQHTLFTQMFTELGKLTQKLAFLKKICNSLFPFSAAALLILRLLDTLLHLSPSSPGLLLKDCWVRKVQSRQHTSRRGCKCLPTAYLLKQPCLLSFELMLPLRGSVLIFLLKSQTLTLV